MWPQKTSPESINNPSTPKPKAHSFPLKPQIPTSEVSENTPDSLRKPDSSQTLPSPPFAIPQHNTQRALPLAETTSSLSYNSRHTYQSQKTLNVFQFFLRVTGFAYFAKKFAFFRKKSHFSRRLHAHYSTRALVFSLALCMASSFFFVACTSDTDKTGQKTFLFGAPQDCAIDPYCLPGLALTYNVIPEKQFVGFLSQEEIAQALKQETIQVARLTNADSLIDREQWVVLTDDSHMVTPDNVVPLLDTRIAALYGSHLLSLLNHTSQTLDTNALNEMVDRVSFGEEAAETVAAAWVKNHRPTGEQGKKSAENTKILIGASHRDENRILAHLYAFMLADAGYSVSVIKIPGSRADTLDALIFGDVHLVPEFASSFLQFAQGFPETSDSQDQTKNISTKIDNHLRTRLLLPHLQALSPAEATTTPQFIVTKETAEAYDLHALSDLQRVFPTTEEKPDTGPEQAPIEHVSLATSTATTAAPGIVKIQLRLIAAGLDPGPPNGIFGMRTRRALIAFQKRNGIPGNGTIDDPTQEALATLPTPPITNTQGSDPAFPTHTATGNPIVYLTLDDGPHLQFTPQILDILQQHGAITTFFVIGQNVEAYPDIVKRAYDEGHSIQNHTQHHRNLRNTSPEAFSNEVLQASNAITEVTGVKPICLRPPEGAVDKNTEKRANALGLSLVMWDIDPTDWKRPSAQNILTHIISRIQPGSIVLLHDGGGKDRHQTVHAIKQLIPALQAQGYVFRPLCVSHRAPHSEI